ncbi:MAG: amidase [Gammaproteobacteria bacterium]|nr:MAG: amidase [Gammaproteobacteria bacterium]
MSRFDEYGEYDAVGLAELIRSGDVTASEVMESAIARTEAVDPVCNCFVTTDFDNARRAARTPGTGPFAGVPFAVKDLWLEWAGAPHSAGTRFTRDMRHETDAPLATAFRRAGLISLGKTNTPEFGITGTTEPARNGPTRNPWNPDYIAGGSSGGSAAAVAAGIVPVAHASDGAGSIRIPAACCGLVGLMPSRGRVERPNKALDVPFSFSRNFIVSRSVRDSAAMLDAVADTSLYGPPAPARDWRSGAELPPGPLRIVASATTPSGRPVDPEIQTAFERSVTLLGDLGHFVEIRDIEADWRRFYRAFGTVGSSQLAADVAELSTLFAREPEDHEFEPLTWRNVRAGRTRTGIEVIEALRELQAFTRQLEAFFTDVDVLLTPVLGTPLPEIGWLDPTAVEPREHDKRSGATFPFTPPFNASGQPAISLPLAEDSRGLPIGMQFVGRFGAELTLLQLATELEAASGWLSRRPALGADT